jgi:hypothetical protein
MAQVVARKEVLSAYRYLLRSMAIAFHGDTVVHTAARREARNRFNLARKFEPESEEAQKGLAEARSVGKFLRENLVQGIKDEESDSYRTMHLCNNVDFQDYGYTTRLNEEIMTQSRILLHCQCPNESCDGKRRIYHSMY